jgi:hypothetical protein
MSDLDGTEQLDTSAEVSSEVSGPENGTPQASSGGNPAWENIRSTLDPISFQLVEPHLKEFDKHAESRISSLNSQLKNYSQLGTPDQLKTYATIAQRLDTEPEVIHAALGQFLRDNGRMPKNEAEVTKAVEDQEEDFDFKDPRVDALAQQQEQMRQFLEAQQSEQIARKAEQDLDAELGSLRQARPELSREDEQEILQRAAFLAMQGKDPNLEDVAADYFENVVNRIRSIPRPGDSAPRLLPTSGGVPSQAQGQSVGQMPSSAVQDIVANFLQQGRS